ncbi:MAG: lytic transglycosylase domain-containing protein, partial [Acidobacteriota bacterium]
MTIDRSLHLWTAPVLVALTLWLGACASSGKVSVKSGASSSASSEEAGQAGPSVVINYEEPEIEEPIEVIELDESVESDGVDDRESEERVAATEEPTPEESALDRSYQLMADVPPNGDALVAQEKEDLRRLISRRIVEVYASRQTTVGDMSLEIPRVMNEYVEREIKSFQGPERDFFVESYQRSGFYRPMIIRELREAGLPEEISWLPLVESGFKSRAMSRARALGLWQFISSTGYRYGLERDWWIDERLDPEKATLGAIGYLTDLHNLFGDWLTAMAAYNCGEHNVLRRINSQRVSYFDQFWDIYTRLPRETRRYVPRFLAVVIIMDDPDVYGFDLP